MNLALEMISLMMKRRTARRRRGLVQRGKEGVEIMMGGWIVSRTGLDSHPGAIFSFHASGHLGGGTKGPGS